MASLRGRGRGRGGGLGSGPEGQQRRGSWRGGPPGSNGNGNGSGTSRTNSPIISGPPSNGPRQSLNDHFADMRKVDDKSRKGFQTDAEISASGQAKRRELVPWSPNDAGAPSARTANGAAGGGPGGHREAETFGPLPTGKWDQFEANKRLFGTESTWDESLYTTNIDKSAPDYQKNLKEAERDAAEIMGKASSNPHIAEERNQVVQGAKELDEEEKYSGVARAANAYVPPAARKTQGGFAAAAARGAAASKPNGQATPNGPASAAPSPAPTPAKAEPRKEEAAQLVAPPVTASASSNAAPAPAPESTLSPPQDPQATRSTSDGLSAPTAPATASDAKTTSPLPDKPADASLMVKTESKDGVVDSFRRFVGNERERVEAKKQSIQKSEREKNIADLKRFHESFKVNHALPKDMLPILTKDEEKQKAIEARAAQVHRDGQRLAEARKLQSPRVDSTATLKSPPSAKKMAMKIQEIPSFDALKKKKEKPPVIPVPESAKQDIPLAPATTATSPPPASGSTPAAKLNPKANAFSFKPNPSAATFKPGQPSTVASPPAAQAPLASATAPTPAAPQQQQQQQQPAAQPVAGPSNTYHNVFFNARPRPVNVNLRDDFVPWRHGPVPLASTISPQWPFTGVKHSFPIGGPRHMDEDMMQGTPTPMSGMPPPFSPYFRYQGGPPPTGVMPNSPMFSPGHGYVPLPGQPMHMGGPPQPNGMPMYYPNGMQPQFMPPHQMQYRQGPGPNQGVPPGGPPGPPPMYYSPQMPTPQQTPHTPHSNLPFPSQAGPFGQIPAGSPMPPPMQHQHSQSGTSAAGSGAGQEGQPPAQA